FPGHAEDIASAIQNDGLSIVWMTALAFTLGYSTLEIGSLGFPIYFWNLADIPAKRMAEESGNAMQSFHDPDELAHETANALRNPDALRKNGLRLREWVIGTFAMQPHAIALQER